MKLVDSSVEIIPQENSILGVYKQIELAGRTCYKSEDKITENSAKAFVDMLINRGHTAPLEHGTIYLKMEMSGLFNQIESAWKKYEENKFSVVNYGIENVFGLYAYITTNVRVIQENGWEDDLKYMCSPTEYHAKRITAKFIISVGIANEFVRHRVFSFCQESSRYCNYAKDKFGKELTFVKPYWLESQCTDLQYDYFIKQLNSAEEGYLYLLDSGLTPQQAREVLPKAVKTELVMTGFESDWKQFFDLRCSQAAHPDARKIANELKTLMYNDKTNN